MLLLSALLLAPFPHSARADSASPQPAQVVTSFHEALLDVMKQAKKLGVKGRYEKLVPVIKKGFQLRLMAQIATGSFWRKADAAELEALVAAFSHLSISTYASQFDGYSGQIFKTDGEKPGPQKTTLIATRIINPGSDTVEITYVTRNIQGAWRIIDVLLGGGISELAVRRSEYRQILKTGGIPGLIKTLNAKADHLLSR
ncbi:MAG: ABC transporter substrate-binding protein [Proteobacteria bacterium]|nr:ABC transporter substrate-binding protein [Pseudomonadota bacterium]MDA1024130.1 ABC transporter substrate-binding protein [Pseudomonadota bacterium]